MRTKCKCLLCAFLAGLSLVTLLSAFAVGNNLAAGKAALVNGAVITGADFYAELGRVLRMRGGKDQGPNSPQLAETKRQVLETLISRELLYQEGRRKGVRATESALDEQMAELKKQFSTEVEFKETLEKISFSESAIRAQVERGMTIQRFIDSEFGGKISVSDEEAGRYYEKHLDSFKKPMQFRISHILIKTDPSWDGVKKAVARNKLEIIQRKLQKGDEFAVLAREYSECRSKSKGGDLGYFKQGQMAKKTEDVIAALNAGEVSGIVEDKFGYHLIRVTEKYPESVLPFEGEKEKIKQTLRREKAGQGLAPYLKRLKADAKIEILLSGDGE
ncbi:MAG: PpiC-type peptidyl-prolyl cis-trans [Geobacteraceae bacterium]|nr:MAG: PpiC-type peptidyl-prolyl cis-trans [Geobacteraceae bacterium]